MTGPLAVPVAIRSATRGPAGANGTSRAPERRACAPRAGLLPHPHRSPVYGEQTLPGPELPALLYLAVVLHSFLVPFRVLMVWLHERTHSFWAVVLMHAPLAAAQLVLVPPDPQGMHMVAYDLLLATILWGLVAAVKLAPVVADPWPGTGADSHEWRTLSSTSRIVGRGGELEVSPLPSPHPVC